MCSGSLNRILDAHSKSNIPRKWRYSVAAISWSDLDSNLKPAPSWRFIVTFPSIPNSKISGQTLQFLVERFTASHKGIEYEPAVFAGSSRHFAVGFAVDALNMVLAETLSYDVVKAFRSWMDIVIDADGNYGLPAKYKKTIRLQPLTEGDDTAVTFAWSGCSPQRIEGYDYDGSQTNHIQSTITMSVDTAIAPE